MQNQQNNQQGYTTHYLDRKQWFLNNIAKAKCAWQIGGYEFMIVNLFFKQVLQQSGELFFAKSHCEDLLKACLIKRCEIIANPQIISHE